MVSITLFERLRSQFKKLIANLGLKKQFKATFNPSRVTHSKSTPSQTERIESAQEVIEALALLGAEDPQSLFSSQPSLSDPSRATRDIHDSEISDHIESMPSNSSLAQELASLIELDQQTTLEFTAQEENSPRQVATCLFSSGPHHLSLRASAWEVVCMTLKLAKVFSKERCLELAHEGGCLSVLELQQIKQHIEQILLKSMEQGDYLFADLTLSDLNPLEAFKEGDVRRDDYVDRKSLRQMIHFIQEVRSITTVRRLQWRHAHRPVPTGDPNLLQRVKRSQRKESH